MSYFNCSCAIYSDKRSLNRSDTLSAPRAGAQIKDKERNEKGRADYLVSLSEIAVFGASACSELADFNSFCSELSK